MKIDKIDIEIKLNQIKLSLKNKKVIAILSLAIIAILFGLTYLLINFRLIGDKDFELCINEKYFENGCIARFLNKQLETDIIYNDVDNSKFGDYTISYQTKFLCFKKTITRNVHVLDNKKPIITLNGLGTCYLTINDEYIEPGYSASDNYDLDISDKVIVSGSVDTSKEGEYQLTYEVSDSSNNLCTATRNIVIKQKNYLALPVNEFWLDEIFPETILKPQENEIDYFDDVVLLGDSNTWFLYKWSNMIKAEQCWGKRNLNVAEINSSVFENFIDGQNRTLDESIKQFSPKYMIISPGIGSPLFMNDTDKYVEELKVLIEYLKTNHPEIKFVFSAILPINEGQLSKDFQKKINIYNYYLAEVCSNYNVKIINFSDIIRGEDGYGIENKFVYSDSNENDRGFHLSVAARQEYVDYLKHCDLKGE